MRLVDFIVSESAATCLVELGEVFPEGALGFLYALGIVDGDVWSAECDEGE